MEQDGLQGRRGGPAWPERVLGYAGRRRTGATVAALQAFVALEFAAWAWSAPLGPDNRTADAILAVVLLVAAVVSLALSRTTRTGWPTPMLFLTSAAILVGVASRLSPQGESLLGTGLMLVAVVAAYVLPRRWFLSLLISTVAAYLIITLSRDLTRPFYPVALSLTVVAVSLLVEDLVRSLRSAALLDPLTGALNRRGLQAAAGSLHAVALRAGQPASVVVIDVDKFKQYNDEHGHAAGDAVLVELTACWRAQLREGDLLARTGGDEFVLMLPGSADRAISSVVTRLHEVSAWPWSYGSASWTADLTFEQCLAQADAELMTAKSRRFDSR